MTGAAPLLLFSNKVSHCHYIQNKINATRISSSTISSTPIFNETGPVKFTRLSHSGKGKGIFRPRTDHEGPEGKFRFTSTLSLTSALYGHGG